MGHLPSLRPSKSWVVMVGWFWLVAQIDSPNSDTFLEDLRLDFVLNLVNFAWLDCQEPRDQ